MAYLTGGSRFHLIISEKQKQYKKEGVWVFFTYSQLFPRVT